MKAQHKVRVCLNTSALLWAIAIAGCATQDMTADRNTTDLSSKVRLDIRHSPAPDIYHPSEDRAQLNRGKATLVICVGADGKRTRPPAVEKTSGFKSLDDATVKWASDARYLPALDPKGKSIDSCSDFKVGFGV